MYCSQCGNALDANDRFCQSCGGAVHVIVMAQEIEPVPEKPKKVFHPLITTFGAVSLTLGIFSLVLFGYAGISLPCGLIGFILGIVATSMSKSRHARKGMAVAGIVVSAVCLGIWLFALLLVGLLLKMLYMGA